VIDWPVSIAGKGGVTAPDTNAVLTVTVSPGEHLEAGGFAESVTLYEYVVVAGGEAGYIDEVAPAMGVVHAPSEYH